MAKKNEKEVINSKMTKQENKNNVKKDKKSAFKDFKAELKKVTWPTPKELVNKTMAVIASVLIVAFIVFIFDVVFENVYNLGTGAIKSAITDSEVVEDTTGAEDTTDAEDTTGIELTEEEESTEEVSETAE